MLSPDSVQSAWCRQELSYARRLQKLIIPVLTPTTTPEDVPPELGLYQLLSFAEGDAFDAAIRQLVTMLGPTATRVGPIAAASGTATSVGRVRRGWRVPALIALIVFGLVAVAFLLPAGPIGYYLAPHLLLEITKIDPLIIAISLLALASLAMNMILAIVLVRRRRKQPAAGPQPASGLIFISYSRSDGDFVDKLEKDLVSEHFKTWVDRRRLEGGQIWDATIVDAIARCQIVLVILSPDALRSQWVRKEYLFALRRGKTLVPIIYHPCPSIPRKLARFHHLDFQAGLNFEAKYRFGLGELVAALDAVPLPRLAAA